MDYLSIKALHIIFVITWFAGLFYIPRIFIYQTEAISKPEPEKSISTSPIGPYGQTFMVHHHLAFCPHYRHYGKYIALPATPMAPTALYANKVTSGGCSLRLSL